MTDRPILFSGPMVRALLDDRKTQTRRILKPQPYEYNGRWWIVDRHSGDCHLDLWARGDVGCRPIHPGDRLWVRETWAPLTSLTHNDPGPQAIIDGGFYRADGGTVDGEVSRWKPSIFMPRHASRLTLIVTDVRVERLQDISEADAKAEGLQTHSDGDADDNGRARIYEYFRGSDDLEWERDPVDAYLSLWDAINGDGAAHANLWVAAYTFTVIKQNIDEIEKVAA
ncbi:hypothetical protein U8C43_24020 [Sinorhizobium meliloti]|nr:hypothetical protein U8C30_24055 [Sinorhizobium meliloti]WQP28930.1 hypothetical protein U8C43_24020 [Sinorhizobium meliloti]